MRFDDSFHHFPKGRNDVRIRIDGNQSLGTYRVECQCGQHWTGDADRPADQIPNPAAPVAEVVVHMRLAHSGELLDLQFSQRFRLWLEAYWRSLSDLRSRSWRGAAGAHLGPP